MSPLNPLSLSPCCMPSHTAQRSAGEGAQPASAWRHNTDAGWLCPRSENSLRLAQKKQIGLCIPVALLL
jgi:hypothetical protein